MNDISHKPRFLLVSMAAAMATMIVPLIGCLFVYFGGSSISSDGTPDNAPYRASLILLFLVPLGFLILTGAWYSLGKVLTSRNALSINTLLVSCVVISIIVGSIFAVEGYNAFGLKDGIFSFLSFFMVTFVSFGLGALAWWLIGKKKA